MTDAQEAADPTAAAAAAAAAVAAEDDGDMDSEADDTRSKLENIKYYASLFLGTACIVCIFAFLFLVPFVLDPAISTIMHEFTEEPVVCKVNNITIKKGRSNCNWSSCREGCTAQIYTCFQVRVLYTRDSWTEGVDAENIWGWVDLTRFDDKEGEVMADTPLLVNIKGCGYAPDINCGSFANKYQGHYDRGETFPCHYSKLNPWMVIEKFKRDDIMFSIVASIAVPNALFVVSLSILLYWYCPYCQAKCRKYEEQVDQDEREFEVDDPDAPQEPPY